MVIKFNKLKTLIVLVFLITSGYLKVSAQQQILQTQYMFNGLSINPAYAGSHEALSLTALYRSQWAGYSEGAPYSYSLSGHMPINRTRIAIGAMAFNESLGEKQEMGFQMAYAYRIPLSDGILSMGLQAGVINAKLNANYYLFNPDDPNFPTGEISSFMPTFGAGLYYSSDNLVLGFSIPNLGIYNNGEGENQVVSIEEIRHYIFSAGYIFDLNSDLKLKPSLLTRYKEGQGVELDLNTTLVINETFWLGASYRHLNSINFLSQIQLTNQLQFGYSYDFPINSEIHQVSSGSHEIMLNYRFRIFSGGDSAPSPGFF
ncbi:MAG: hypothetical protein CMO01_21765 [Thalassobius sp.]|nr:hypothetical protein [Thalassovita sp.]